MERKEWNQLVKIHGDEFLQSYDWGEFQSALGRRVERIADDHFLAQVVFYPLPFGLEYGYIARGPVALDSEIRKDALWSALEKVRSPKTVFFEIEPTRAFTFLKAVSHTTRQPRQTSILNLNQDVDKIYSNFHKTLRYNIRLAERKGILIKKEKSWELFFDLLKLTARRQNFRIWTQKYYELIWQTLVPEGQAEIWSAYFNNHLLTSNLYILFGDRVTYLFGASDYQRRSLMAPHFLHWQAIREFKERGFGEYDFWGINKKKWPGVTTFKVRFGGEDVTYPGSYKKVERPLWFSLYKTAKRLA